MQLFEDASHPQFPSFGHAVAKLVLLVDKRFFCVVMKPQLPCGALIFLSVFGGFPFKANPQRTDSLSPCRCAGLSSIFGSLRQSFVECHGRAKQDAHRLLASH